MSLIVIEFDPIEIASSHTYKQLYSAVKDLSLNVTILGLKLLSNYIKK